METRPTTSLAAIQSRNGGEAFSSLPPSLYRDQLPLERVNSGIAELLVVIGVCATLAGMIAASVQGAMAAGQEMQEFAAGLVAGAVGGFVVGLIVSFFQAPRLVTIPVGMVFGPLVGAAVASVLTVPEAYRSNVGLASIGGAVVLGAVVLAVSRLRRKRS